MRQLRIMITMVALASYLLTVTAALPLHRCDMQRSDPVRATASAGCAHCFETCAIPLPFDDAASNHLDLVGGGHHPADCFVCQVLAQKSLSAIVVPAFGWTPVFSKTPRADHRRPVLSPRFTWSSRAPPVAA